MTTSEPEQPTVHIDLIGGRVIVDGVDVHIAPAEAAVLFMLGVGERPIPRDVLAERLYSTSDGDRAIGTLKVNVCRARRRVGRRDAITSAGGRYALGPCVDVELRRLEAMLRSIRPADLTDCERRALLDIRERGRAGRPNFVLGWAWFEEVERRVRDLIHDATLIAAEDGLLQGRHLDAIELASELIQEDPLDETAAEVLLRASIQRGDRTGAALYFRHYSDALAREMGARPSPALRTLIDSAAHGTSVAML